MNVVGAIIQEVPDSACIMYEDHWRLHTVQANVILFSLTKQMASFSNKSNILKIRNSLNNLHFDSLDTYSN